MNSFQIGFIGLGAMGQAIVARILRAGYPITVYDLSEAAVNSAVSMGAKEAKNLKQLAASKELVFICVSHADITEQLVCEPGGLLDSMSEGGVIVDLGTTPPEQCRELAKKAASKGKVFLDVPISGSTPWAEAGSLAMMVGGDKPAYERVLPVLTSFADKIHYLGESGSGQLLKLCHQLTFAATLNGLSEAIALAERNGQNATTVLKVLSDCVAPNHVIDFMLPLAKNDTFDQGQGSLKLVYKDLQAVLRTAQEVDIKLPLAEVLSAYMIQAMEGGWEEADLFALVDMARNEFYSNRG
ncbi:MAG: 3-hydroxyisobutyrate dehydrogenase-like beta-hydroxyacid dehydrogenase [Cycloclasticus sp.]|jgi:3-hydroxyisobutyrate dehydrogenase-like beta-hydroxyacid dehydrogenase